MGVDVSFPAAEETDAVLGQLVSCGRFNVYNTMNVRPLAIITLRQNYYNGLWASLDPVGTDRIGAAQHRDVLSVCTCTLISEGLQQVVCQQGGLRPLASGTMGFTMWGTGVECTRYF